MVQQAFPRSAILATNLSAFALKMLHKKLDDKSYRIKEIDKQIVGGLVSPLFGSVASRGIVSLAHEIAILIDRRFCGSLLDTDRRCFYRLII